MIIQGYSQIMDIHWIHILTLPWNNTLEPHYDTGFGILGDVNVITVSIRRILHMRRVGSGQWEPSLHFATTLCFKSKEHVIMRIQCILR